MYCLPLPRRRIYSKTLENTKKNTATILRLLLTKSRKGRMALKGIRTRAHTDVVTHTGFSASYFFFQINGRFETQKEDAV